jgi:hypothetical protein
VTSPELSPSLRHSRIAILGFFFVLGVGLRNALLVPAALALLVSAAAGVMSPAP